MPLRGQLRWRPPSDEGDQTSAPQVVRVLLISIVKTLSCGYYLASLLLTLWTGHATDRNHPCFPCPALLIGLQRHGRSVRAVRQQVLHWPRFHNR